MYTPYSYYKDIYGGQLSESAYNVAEPRAEAALRYLTYMNGDIFAKESGPVMLAVCAATDIVGEDNGAQAQGSAASAGSIKSESNDGYSVTYVTTAKDGETAEQTQRRRIAEAVRLYLLPTGWLRRKVRCC